MRLHKLLPLIIVAFLPLTVSAAAVSWISPSPSGRFTYLNPVNGIQQTAVANNFIASSTVDASIFNGGLRTNTISDNGGMMNIIQGSTNDLFIGQNNNDSSGILFTEAGENIDVQSTSGNMDINTNATTTSNQGINLSFGCYAINNTCISGGSGTNFFSASGVTISQNTGSIIQGGRFTATSTNGTSTLPVLTVNSAMRFGAEGQQPNIYTYISNGDANINQIWTDEDGNATLKFINNGDAGEIQGWDGSSVIQQYEFNTGAAGTGGVAWILPKFGAGTTSPTYQLSVEGTSTLGNQAIAGYFTATTTATSTLPSVAITNALNEGQVQVMTNSGYQRLFTSTSTTPYSLGQTLINALAIATASSTVRIGPGIYDTITNTLTVPRGASIIGSGRYVTYINSEAGTTIFALNTNDYLASFSITATIPSADQLVFNGALNSAQNVLINDVYAFGAQDVVYCNTGSNSCSFTIDNSEIYGNWDLIRLISGTKSSVLVKDSTIAVTGPGLTGQSRGVAAGIGTITLYNDIVSAVNGGTDTDAALYTDGGSIIMQEGSLTTSNNSTALAYDAENVSGSITINSDVNFHNASTTGIITYQNVTANSLYEPSGVLVTTPLITSSGQVSDGGSYSSGNTLAYQVYGFNGTSYSAAFAQINAITISVTGNCTLFTIAGGGGATQFKVARNLNSGGYITYQLFSSGSNEDCGSGWISQNPIVATPVNQIQYTKSNIATTTTGLPYSIDTDLPLRISQDFATTSLYSLLEIGSTTLTGALFDYLSVANGGFGTTTLSGLNVKGSATSTSNVGFNITTGCYAINGTCLSSGSGSSSVGPINTLQASNGAGGFIATGTPQITVGNVLATSTATSTFQALTIGGGVTGGISFNYVSPPSNNIVATPSTSGGILTAATYKYWVTYVIADGSETQLSPLAVNAIVTGTTGSVALTNLPISTDPRVTARHLYKGTTGNGANAPWTIIANNTTTSFTDDGSIPILNGNQLRLAAGSGNYGNNTDGKFYDASSSKLTVSISEDGLIHTFGSHSGLIIPAQSDATTPTQQFRQYNTADETNNSEFFAGYWQNNIYTLGTVGRGSGAARELRLQSSNASTNFTLGMARGGADSTSNWLNSVDMGTSNTNLNFVSYNPEAWTGSSGVNSILNLGSYSGQAMTMTQSGSAGYNILNIDLTEATLGTGVHNFVNFKIAGTTQFQVDHSGATGIATTSKSAMLTIQAIAASTTLNVASSTGATDLGVDSNDRVVIGTAGTVVLSSGVKVVTPNVLIDSNTIPFIQELSSIGTCTGVPEISATTSTTFTITSSVLTDNCMVGWFIIERYR